MYRHCFARIVALLALLAVFSLGTYAQAQTYYWDVGGNIALGGSGNWSISDSNWSTSSSGDATQLAWPSASSGYSAEFINGNGPIFVNGAVNADSITFDPGTFYTLSGTGTINLTLGGGSITANANAQIDAWISGSVGLTKAGSSALVLTNPGNNYTGGTTVSAGTLQLGNGTNVGTTNANLGINGNYGINSGATLAIVATTGAGGSFSTFGSAFSGAGTLLVSGNNTSSNTGGASQFTTSLATAFSGTVAVQNSIYKISSSSNYGGATGLQTLSGGALWLTSAGTYSVPITVAGSGAQTGWSSSAPYSGAIRIIADGITVASPITLTANAMVFGNLGGGTTTYTGQISGPYTAQFGSVSGYGTLVLAPTGAGISCPTAVMADAYSTVKAGNANAFGTSDWIMMSNNGEILATNGYNVNLYGLDGSGGIVQNGASTSSTLSIGADNGNHTYGGTFQDGSTGSLGIIKTGTGSLMLTSVNAGFSGGVAVNQGTLVLETASAVNPIVGSNLVTVNSGGTLVTFYNGNGRELGMDGNGIVPISVNGGTFFTGQGNYNDSNSLTMNGGLVAPGPTGAGFLYVSKSGAVQPTISITANPTTTATIASAITLATASTRPSRPPRSPVSRCSASCSTRVRPARTSGCCFVASSVKTSSAARS